MSNFMKIRRMEAELFHADRRADEAKLFVAFRNFANAPNNQLVNAVFINGRCLFSDPYETNKYTVWGRT